MLPISVAVERLEGARHYQGVRARGRWQTSDSEGDRERSCECGEGTRGLTLAVALITCREGPKSASSRAAAKNVCPPRRKSAPITSIAYSSGATLSPHARASKTHVSDPTTSAHGFTSTYLSFTAIYQCELGQSIKIHQPIDWFSQCRAPQLTGKSNHILMLVCRRMVTLHSQSSHLRSTTCTAAPKHQSIPLIHIIDR